MGNPADPIAGLSPLKRALIALDDMKSRLDAAERSKREPIAIIGMGCRFPGGANDADSFWSLLRDGVDTVREVPKARWNVDAYYDPDPDAVGKAYVRWGAFLDEFDRFDPQFFGIAPREAAGMDPQQRLLLEVAWEAFEDAAVSPEQASGTATGVFVGINSMDYAALQLQRADIEKIDAYSLSGTAHSIAAGRLAYVLGLQGPAIAVDTACSSSLVAVHLACQSLRNDECRTAIAGGVQITLSPLNSVVFSKLRMLAADGRCKAFDARGDGFVEGEGCGVVILKRLSDALADGDRVLAVIRASAVNQDGASSGLTAPNGPSQEAVIRAALDRGGILPAEVDYVEAHGTGTALGDPIEVQALASVLGQGRPAERPLLIGSVKTNLGHTQAAAGIAGLVKLALALDREHIPPSLHFEQPNPHIPWDTLPVKVVKEATPWPRGRARRIGGVSSFGFSGTNVHVVLEEAPLAERAAQEADRPLHVLALSAKSETALRAVADRWAARVRSLPDARVADVAFTANAGRAHLPERVAIAAATREEALARLAAVAEGGIVGGARGRAPADRPKVAFLCTGQGAQYVGMGRQLYETQPAFRQALDRCADLLREELEQPLLSVLYPSSGVESPIDQTACAQPALFAIEYALAELWKSWGVVPSAALGHSVGEYVAACLAGVFTLEDAIKLVALRGRLMQSLPAGGAMAAVFASEERVRAAIAPDGDRIAIAAVNASDNIVVSGQAEAVADLLARLNAAGVSSERLNVSHAFHSPLMDPILDELEGAVSRVPCRSPRIPLISNLTGRPARGEICSAEYWRRHLRETVLFRRGVGTLSEMGFSLFLELGPRPTLSSLAARSLPADAVLLPSLRKAGQDWTRMLESVAELYVRGAEIDWAGFDHGYSRRKLAMPTYPFERERYWLPGLDAAGGARRTRRAESDAGSHPLLGTRLSSALTEIQFESDVSVDAPAFLADHRKRGAAVFPATAYLEMGLAAAREALGEGPYVFNELVIGEPLILGDDPVRLQAVLSPDDSGTTSFRLFSRDEEAAGTRERWRLHGTGSICRAEAASPGGESDTLDAIKARCTDALSVEEHYAQLRADGHEYGPAFRGVEGLWRGDWEALGAVRLPDAIRNDAGAYHLHPALLDAAMQVLASAVPPALAGANGDTYLPVSLGRCRVYAGGVDAGWSHVRLTPPAGAEPDGFAADVRLYDDEGRLIAEVEDVYHKRMSAGAFEAAARKTMASWLYETVWRPEPRVSAADGRADGSWIVLTDAGEATGRAVAERLARHGARVVIVARGSEYREAGGLVQIDPSRPEDFVRMLEHALTPGPPLEGIVDLWNASRASAGFPEEPTIAAQNGCNSLLHLAQALDGAEAVGRPRLVVVTRGAIAVGGSPRPVAFWQAPVWALARTISLEHHDLHCVCIDLDPDSTDHDIDFLAAEVLSPDEESQVAMRGGRRHVARLVRSAAAAPLAEGEPRDAQPVALEISERGVLDRLELRPLTRRVPGPGEVEIRVRAAGLNFRDVLNALGMYEGDAGPLGSECVGTVVAVGAGVTHLKVGDEVLGMAPASFRTYVTAPAGPFIVKPAALDVEDAATIPITFLTADYALNTLGRMRVGDRVLIHAAAGGVGLAAVQLAKRAGAEIFATAGSPEKHAHLRSLGVTHVFSSRSLDFSDQILERTGGKGVDIVLNSLAGEFIGKSVATLGRGGRFLEIGKAGIWSAEEMAEARPDVEYHPIYFSPDDHARVRQMLSDLVGAVTSGNLAPLPRRSFPVSDAIAAFRYMAQARHIGKIVLSFDAVQGTSTGPAVVAGGTYLITGGLGALGLSVARWIVGAGARHVVLASRGRPSAEIAAEIAALEESGARVMLAQADVSRQADVAALLAQISAAMPPLRGIVHAAGVVDDGLLVQQTAARFETVFAPKAAGAWHLQRQTENLDLDFFVLFSSMTSLFGGPGQGNYAAANAFLDALADDRRASGRPALSIQWGSWAGAGMAGRVSARDRQRWLDQGFGSIPPADGVRVLDHLIRHAASAASSVAVLPIDWARWFQQFPAGAEPPLVRELAAGHSRRGAAQQPPRRRLVAEVEAVAPNRQRIVVEAFLREEALKVLGLDTATMVDVRQPLHELGLDSLMAVELRNGISAALDRTLPATLLFKHPTLEALGDFVMSIVGGAPAPALEPSHRPEATDERFENLSDEETKALLAEELKSLALSGFTPDDPGS